MAAIPWPSTLNNLLEQDGFQLALGDTTIRSSMDVGPAKVRRRFTNGVDTLSGTLRILFSEYSALKHFYDVTLNGGVEKFSTVHPVTGVLAEFRFVSPPSFRPLGGGYWSVSMNWEELPA